jgi:hypothetical protein
MTTITQCDAGLLLQINETQKRFLPRPLEDLTAPAASGPGTQGGIVTYTTTVVDTGERQTMFGMPARHLRRTIVREPDANACDRRTERVETDGWYVDTPSALACSAAGSRPQVAAAGTGCRDQLKYVDVGPPAGYPIAYTMTTTGPDGSSSVMTMAVTAWESQTVPDALFAAPDGYAEVRTLAQLLADARTGIPRIGVLKLANRTKDAVALDVLSEALVSALDEIGVDAVLLTASSAAEALAEAREKSCDYLLTTLVADLDRPSKGILSRVTGSKEYGARLEYSLTVPGSAKPRLTGSERSGASVLQSAVITARNVSRYVTPFGLLSSQFKFMNTFSELTGGTASPAMRQSSDPVLSTVFSLVGAAPAERPDGEILQSGEAAVAAALEKAVAAIAADLRK